LGGGCEAKGVRGERLAQARYTAGDLPGTYGVVAAVGQVESRARVEISDAPPPALAPSDTWDLTFTTPGVYPYFDAYAPAHTGTVVVGAQTLRVSENPKGIGHKLSETGGCQVCHRSVLRA